MAEKPSTIPADRIEALDQLVQGLFDAVIALDKRVATLEGRAERGRPTAEVVLANAQVQRTKHRTVRRNAAGVKTFQ